MKADGTSKLDISRELLWPRLSDPRQLEELVPGVESVELLNKNRFIVRVATEPAPGATPLLLEIEIKERRKLEHVRLEGTGRGGDYAATFHVVIDLEPNGAGTVVRWNAEAEFDGSLSSIGQRVLPLFLSGQVDRILQAAAESSPGSTSAPS
jgi:carbon monoxide dehydrogenase subunit G